MHVDTHIKEARRSYPKTLAVVFRVGILCANMVATRHEQLFICEKNYLKCNILSFSHTSEISRAQHVTKWLPYQTVKIQNNSPVTQSSFGQCCSKRFLMFFTLLANVLQHAL